MCNAWVQLASTVKVVHWPLSGMLIFLGRESFVWETFEYFSSCLQDEAQQQMDHMGILFVCFRS